MAAEMGKFARGYIKASPNTPRQLWERRNSKSRADSEWVEKNSVLEGDRPESPSWRRIALTRFRSDPPLSPEGEDHVFRGVFFGLVAPPARDFLTLGVEDTERC